LLHKASRTLTIGVLTEIIGLDNSAQYASILQQIYTAVLHAVNSVYPIANLSGMKRCLPVTSWGFLTLRFFLASQRRTLAICLIRQRKSL
jgi:hypothetical protein